MLSIGDFARFTGVSVRRLRHYDALGLLPPAYVDPTTGYRQYSAGQFPRMHRLLALQDLGFTLEQMGPILDAAVGPVELRGMLLAKQAEVAASVESERARLRLIEARLRLVEREIAMPEHEFVEKPLPAVLVAQLTEEVAGVEDIPPVIGPLFGRLMGGLGAAGVTPAAPNLAWYEGRGDRMGLGAAAPIAESSREAALSVDGVEVTELASCERALVVTHYGAMDTISQTWQDLVTEAESRGLGVGGKCREVYLETPMDQPDAWVTELQQPIG